MKNFTFRKAVIEDKNSIWNIIQQAILRRKADGSNQWQDDYPNEQSIENDIVTDFGFVLVNEEKIIGYCAVIINYEPAYDAIEGKWLTNDDFVVIHRIAIDENYLGQGLSGKIIENVEKLAKKNNIFSVKVDTNFDNIAMMKIFEKRGYQYCGEVYFRGSARRAYEKVLK
ncbi:GNAT family N-acetyltransferase [Flavobacterium haoranii]|uniref:Ribosomal protein S18 acetylase RimI n=1 Tax=Flavobacterium haoranii TaxID=683124 RepID=A0A1M6JYV6_9FLAO|nr:GNAT family N-acetyltransferase [Flavobacterium haoranii]SHJ51867.1 Ribosomal protein S18 acetylase RimI [Flavobacterium haoranii]